MHSNRYTLIFVFIVTVVLGTILSFTKENLRESQENNLKADVNKPFFVHLVFQKNKEALGRMKMLKRYLLLTL